MVKMAPVAKIANIAEGDIIREGLFNLVGTADDADPSDTVKYKLALIDKDGNSITVTPKPRDAQGYREGRIADASFGDLDFTMLKNNYYTLQLTVQSDDGIDQAEVEFALNSELKIGQMSFSQQDLVIPVNGQPISVIRTYNSMNTAYTGDFGPGWTYSIKDMEVEINEKRGFGQDEYGESFPMRIGGSRDVTVTMPDGKRLSFYYDVVKGGGYFPTYWAYWRPGPGNYASLVPTCSNEIVALPGGMQYWTASGPQTPMDQFDIPGFILTLKDGTKYLIEREHVGDYFLMGDDVTSGTTFIQSYGKASLKQITDNNGNRLEFNDNGIQSYNADGEKTKSIVFDRDSANGNRITAIYAPSSLNEDGTKPEGAIPQFKYEYDAQGNLTKVHKLIDRTKPVDQQYAVTEYLYENADRPHYVTAIKDALGNTPMKCIYDEDGRLIATEDANGNRIAMNHDLSGRTETITDRMGNPTIHTYDEMGNVTATIDAQGNATRYTYDNLGNKLSETNALGYTTSYTYDAQGNQTSVTDALGNVTTFEYNGKGKEIKFVDPLGNSLFSTYDNVGNLLSFSDGLGNNIRYQYDTRGNLISVYNAAGNLQNSYSHDPNGRVTQATNSNQVTINYFYDANGNQIRSNYTWNGANGSRELVTHTIYNDAGEKIKVIDPEGNKSETIYNKLGKIWKQIDSQGNITEYTYDTQGNIIETRYPDGTLSRKTYDPNGRESIIQGRHLLGEGTSGIRKIYNSLGKIIRIEQLDNVQITISDGNSVLDSLGNIISSEVTEYDVIGRRIRSIDGNGNVTQYEYDILGNNSCIIDPLGNRTEFSYDESGRLSSQKDALNQVIQYEYNVAGQVTKQIQPDGSYIQIKYNSLGQKIEEIDAAGLATKYEYDQAGRLMAVVKTEVNGEIPRWEYTYNQYGQRISIKDPKGNVTSFTYDYAGRQLSRTLPMGQRETAEYNSLGQLVKQTDFKGQTVEIVYDTLGRKTAQKYYAAGSTTSSDEVRFTYDSMGRIQSVVQDSLENAEDGTLQSSLRETAYAYNNRGELTQISTPEGSVNYEYDAQSGAKTRVYTANSDVRYTYDALNRLKTVAVHMRNGASLATPEVTTYNYTKIGSRASVALPNGVTTNYQYDNLNRLTQLTHEKAGTPIASYSYELLPTGHRAAVTEITPEGSSEIRYTYDNLYRLTKEVRTGVKPFTASYAYDINSNRIQKVLASVDENDTTNYTYNANDQLTTEVSSSNGTTVYVYDANGSLITKENTGKFSYQYNYDLRNRLASANITRKEGLVDTTINSRYAYNADGIRTRVMQTVNGVMQNRYFLLDNGHTGYSQVFEETSSLGGNVVRSYVIGDDVLSQTVGSVTSHLLYDGHGSTRQLVNSNGEITNNYAYDAYGKMLGGDPNVTDKGSATDLLYAGEQFDSGLQMEYLRARYYDANTGRFNRLDPFAGNCEDPQSLHKYAYAHSDPVNGIDPSGEVVLGFLATMSIGITLNVSLSLGIRYATGKELFSDEALKEYASDALIAAATAGFGSLAANLTRKIAIQWIKGAITGIIAAGGGQAVSELLDIVLLGKEFRFWDSLARISVASFGGATLGAIFFKVQLRYVKPERDGTFIKGGWGAAAEYIPMYSGESGITTLKDGISFGFTELLQTLLAQKAIKIVNGWLADKDEPLLPVMEE